MLVSHRVFAGNGLKFNSMVYAQSKDRQTQGRDGKRGIVVGKIAYL
jgi:hypothetical protein